MFIISQKNKKLKSSYMKSLQFTFILLSLIDQLVNRINQSSQQEPNQNQFNPKYFSKNHINKL